MKKILTIVWLAIIAGACSLNDSLNLNEGNGKINEKESFSTGGVSAMSISPGLKYYFKASNGASIYRSNVNCSSFSESIGVLGNGALSPYGPAATIFNGKIYLFHKGNTNNYIYYSTSTDGVNWTSDTILPNGAQTVGTASATVHNGRIYVIHPSNTSSPNIYISMSPDGVNWGSEIIVPVTNYDHNVPSIFSSGGNLYLCYAKIVSPYAVQRTIMRSTDNGFTWSVWSDSSAPYVAPSAQNEGFSVTADPLGGATMLYSDNTYLKVSFSTNLISWSTPQNVTSAINGQQARTSQRPVITWDSSCGRHFAVYKGYNNNNIYKAYTINGTIRESGTLQGTTTHGPYVISN